MHWNVAEDTWGEIGFQFLFTKVQRTINNTIVKIVFGIIVAINHYDQTRSCFSAFSIPINLSLMPADKILEMDSSFSSQL